MNEDKQAIEYFEELMKLMKENPKLSVIPMVNLDVVASDDFQNWAASFGKCRVDKVLNGYDVTGKNSGVEGLSIDDERIYFYSYNDEDIADAIINALDDNHESYDDKKVDDILNSLPWQEVIVISVTTPNP